MSKASARSSNGVQMQRWRLAGNMQTTFHRQKVTVPKYVQSNKPWLLCFSEGRGASPMLPQVTKATSTTWDDSDVQKRTTGPSEDSFKYWRTDTCRALGSDPVHGAISATDLRLCPHRAGGPTARGRHTVWPTARGQSHATTWEEHGAARRRDLGTVHGRTGHR